jgi:hypothetical protein
MLTHNCQHCGEDLPVSEFWKNKSKPFGLDIWCKNCYKSLPSYAARLERSRNGYRPPSARNEVRRAKAKAKRESANV